MTSEDDGKVVAADFAGHNRSGREGTNPVFEADTRDGELARALNVAMHALSVHSGMAALSEGERIMLDFADEIAVIRRALALLGVQPGETLPYISPRP